MIEQEHLERQAIFSIQHPVVLASAVMDSEINGFMTRFTLGLKGPQGNTLPSVTVNMSTLDFKKMLDTLDKLLAENKDRIKEDHKALSVKLK